MQLGLNGYKTFRNNVLDLAYHLRLVGFHTYYVFNRYPWDTLMTYLAFSETIQYKNMEIEY